MSDKYTSFGDARMMAGAVVIGFIAAFIGLLALTGTRDSGQPQLSTSTLLVLPEPLLISDFELIDHTGQPFTLDRLRGNWSLVFFGFSHCPDTCPNTLYEMKGIKQAFGRKQPRQAKRLQIVFISIDPERDTPSDLGQYVQYFDPDFIGVTGSHEQIALLTRQVGIEYEIEKHLPGDKRYDIDHTASVLLSDPQGRIHGVFPTPHDSARMTSDLVKVIQ